MSKHIRRALALVLAMVMCLGLCTTASAAERDTAEKSAALLDRDTNRYEIEVQVPGEDGSNIHDEVIVMVDGSYSMDEEWEDMKKAILTIGQTVLNGSGNTQLTLMSFGISPNVVLEHIVSVEELEASLPAKPGGLLYGRSSTNCHGAFEGIQHYIRNHDETLNEAFVIFLSDGGVNMDSAPLNWMDAARKINANNAAAVVRDELIAVAAARATASEAAQRVFGDAYTGMVESWKKVVELEAQLIELDSQIEALEAKDVLTEAEQAELAALKNLHAETLAAYNTAYTGANTASSAIIAETDENGKTRGQQWVAAVYEDFYAYAGLDPAQPYPVYTAETAYVDYCRACNTYFNNTFYYVLGISGYGRDTSPYGGKAAAAAANVAAMDQVSQLYVVRYGTDYRSGWMTSIEGTSFIQSDNVAALAAVLEASLTDLAKTPFNDVVVTDYMSKWVNLDPSTLKIVDNRTSSPIWTAADGWLIEEGRPTAQEIPVVAEIVDTTTYADGGEDVTGNTSGEIYRLTWYLKDGPMLRADNYSLKYEVTVDTEEEGFCYNVNYPANGTTSLAYTDDQGLERIEDIRVPDTVVPKLELDVTFPAGGASNISYMLIDPQGNVEFLYKIDLEDGQTSAPIEVKEGYISAMFIKQAQSGKFWISEDVSEETVEAVIACLKANNPSYKGHDEQIAFGYGAHDLNYRNGKKIKTVTYVFGA